MLVAGREEIEIRDRNIDQKKKEEEEKYIYP